METIYDWITLGVFAGLVVLFLQRSVGEEAAPNDSLLMYLAAGVGCAVVNYFGNEEQHIVAIPLLLLTLGFIVRYLKPFSSSHG